MWDAYDAADTFCITCNSCVRSDGSLVMGAGIARQARDRFPGLALALGQKIEGFCGHLGTYGAMPTEKLWAFQTKWHWKSPSSTRLIRTSARVLSKIARGEVHLNFPGTGCGGLSTDAVRPVLEQELNNVNIWQRQKSSVSS
jgi:hypothetical protein